MKSRITTADRIVYEFEHNVTECHRKAIETTLGITPVQFDAAIARARDLGVELDPPLRLTPLYGFDAGNGYDDWYDGWWTCRPTERITAIAVQKSLERNLGEQTRNARVLAGTRLDEFASYAAAGLDGTIAAYMQRHKDLLGISPFADYVVGAIDDAKPRLYVGRKQEPLAA